jgi:PAS domain-containing protein
MAGETDASIVGIVRYYSPVKSITILDQTGQIIVRTLQTMPLQIGEVIEATGRPFIWGSDWLLREAIVRRASPEALQAINDENRNADKLRIASQILELTPEQAAEGKAVRIFGTVVWIDETGNSFIVRDTSGGVLIRTNQSDAPIPKIRFGTRITGVTTAGPYAPEIIATEIDYWGVALLPEAKLITLDQAMAGLDQGNRIEISGHVKEIKNDGNTSLLKLGTATGEFTVRLVPSEPLENLRGSIISVRGICQGLANDRRQLTGIEVWTHSIDEIRVEQAAPTDPFSVPMRKIGSFRQYNANASLHRWVRVEGVVIHQEPGRFVFIEDGSDGLMILTSQTESLSPGDSIEATGLPGLQNARVVLRESVFRKTGTGRHLEPIAVDDPRKLDDQLESRLVTVRGTLITTIVDKGTVDLAVEANGIVFNALLSKGDASGLALEPGSILDLTGVYEMVRDERGQTAGLRLQLRESSDIIVVKNPSWWTARRLIFVSSALAFCIAVGLAWVSALRRRVNKQTEQIRAQLTKEANLEANNREIVEDASDCIFTTDLTGRITSFNPAGERMTGYAREEALGQSDRRCHHRPYAVVHLSTRRQSVD